MRGVSFIVYVQKYFEIQPLVGLLAREALTTISVLKLQESYRHPWHLCCRAKFPLTQLPIFNKLDRLAA